MVAADVTFVPNKDNGGIAVDQLIKSINNQTKLLVVLTPNNPTGLMLSEEEIYTVCHETRFMADSINFFFR